MNFFNIFKKDPWKKIFKEMNKAILPNSEDDIVAGTNELMNILNNTIDEEKARPIFLKSIAISYFSEGFTKQRLIEHLDRYCLQFFNDDQVDKFYGYLVALRIAMGTSKKSASEVKKKDGKYYW